MLTVAHFVDCTANPAGTEVYQYGQKMGTVPQNTSEYTYHSLQEDWMLVEQGPDTEVSGYDNEIEDYAGKLSGHVTEDGLKDFMCSNSKPVYKQGWKTCKREGCITDRNKSETICSTSKDGFIELDLYNEKGDSGSILFKQYTYNNCYYTAPIAIINGGYDSSEPTCNYNDPNDDDFATSTTLARSAYSLNNQYGISFDPDFSLGC